jgi:GxxExxY protein
MSEPPGEHDLLAREIVDAAFAVHTLLGPGLLESVYDQCLVYESEAREIPFPRQVAMVRAGRPIGRTRPGGLR